MSVVLGQRPGQKDLIFGPCAFSLGIRYHRRLVLRTQETKQALGFRDISRKQRFVLGYKRARVVQISPVEVEVEADGMVVQLNLGPRTEWRIQAPWRRDKAKAEAAEEGFSALTPILGGSKF